MSNETNERGYEAPDPAERPATAAPTEGELEHEAIHPPVLPYHADAPKEKHDPYAALRSPAYLRYSAGWMAAVIGQSMTLTALGWELYDVTKSKLALGWLAGIQVIPLVLLALSAGVLADMFDRRRIIFVSSMLVSACSVGLAIMSYRPGGVPWMYLLVFCSATLLTLGRPARSALLPLIVPEKVFTNAVTWNASFFQIAAMVGPGLGGLIMARSVRTVYLIDAACAVVFALLVQTLPKPAPRERAKVDEPAMTKLTGGLRFVWNSNIILATLTLDLFAVLLGGAAYLLPVFTQDILLPHRPDLQAVANGWLRASESVGALVMTLWIAHRPPMQRAGRAILLAVAAFGLCTIGFGLSRWFWLSFMMLFLTGAFDSISVVVRHTLVQVLTPDEMRGRVSSVNNIFIGASNELGGLESGLTAHWWGPVRSVVIGGLGTIGVVCAIAWRFPGLRKYGRLTKH